VRCQTYEGGIGGEPGNEAHGGYTFCAVAAMVLLGELHLLDTRSLRRWVLMRQVCVCERERERGRGRGREREREREREGGREGGEEGRKGGKEKEHKTRKDKHTNTNIRCVANVLLTCCQCGRCVWREASRGEPTSSLMAATVFGRLKN
jgi:hypothetical protein